MSQFFLKVVNMSICASCLVVAVLLLRLVLKKAPKWINVLLWGIVALRLLIPVSIQSDLSLVPEELTNGQIISSVGDLYINSPWDEQQIIATFATPPKTVENTAYPILSWIWLAGVVLMISYTAVSYWLLRRKIATAVLFESGIYQSEYVDSPFVLGVMKPKIYLPFHLDQQTLEYVIAHEQAHIRRKDHWWKPIGFILLALHWFNPLMWLGYILLCRDIELACDEKVIKEMDSETKANYTQALVTCSVNRRSIAACPLAFGEVGVKGRVKSVLNYKKPAFWIIVAAIVACAVVAVCFLTDPVKDSGAAVNYDAVPPSIKYPWVQEYTPGADGIIGNVDIQEYQQISPDFAIGADRRGMAVFKDPHKAFLTLTALYTDGIRAIQAQYDLAPLSESDYDLYEIYGWQTTVGSKKAREQAAFVTCFFDIYENSFIDETPADTVEFVNTVTTGLKTYYELSDGTYRADGRNYKYRLDIHGRMHNAAADTSFVYLSNLETITFDQAWRAAGYSSNTEDYFAPEEAVLVNYIVHSTP